MEMMASYHSAVSSKMSRALRSVTVVVGQWRMRGNGVRHSPPIVCGLGATVVDDDDRIVRHRAAVERRAVVTLCRRRLVKVDVAHRIARRPATTAASSALLRRI